MVEHLLRKQKVVGSNPIGGFESFDPSTILKTFIYSNSTYMWYIINKKNNKQKMSKTTLHYTHPTGIALGITAGMVYSICALFVFLWPTQTVRFFSDWFHGIDIGSLFIAPQLTFGTFFNGLIKVIIFFYITGVIYGFVYNKCVAHCKRKGWI